MDIQRRVEIGVNEVHCPQYSIYVNTLRTGDVDLRF